MAYGSNCCLVFIDNDLIIIGRMKALFSAEFQCYIAMTGEEGLALLRELSSRQILVVCSSELPDMSALDLCYTIKSKSPQIFVMLLANDSGHEARLEGLLARADNYIDKNILGEELHLLVSNISTTMGYLPDDDIEVPEIASISDEIFCALETEAREFIESYYQLTTEQRVGKECSSKCLAEHLGRSHRSFQREIKKETGYSFKQLKLVVRLEEAQRLFAEGYNVNQVADLLSFSSPAHLSRAFKDEFGIAPSKYRLQL